MIDRRLFVLFWAVSSTGCGTGQGTLEVTASASTVGNRGEAVTIRAVATDDKGKIGAGTVTFKANAGTVTPAATSLDPYGTTKVSFTCDATADADCAGAVDITAEWTPSKGAVVSATTSVNVKTASGAGGGTGAGGGSGFLDCVPPQFKLMGPVGVSATALNFDSSNAVFELRNSHGPPIVDYWDFLAGQGIDIIVKPKPVVEFQEWHVFLFHSPPNTPGQKFTLGPFDAMGGTKGPGVKIRGPSTTCTGFLGGNYYVSKLELNASNQVVHITAEIHPLCPDPLHNQPGTLSTGVICF